VCGKWGVGSNRSCLQTDRERYMGRERKREREGEIWRSSTGHNNANVCSVHRENIARNSL